MPDSGASLLYRNARREAVLAVVVTAGALIWSVGYCYLRGYSDYPADSWVVQIGLATPRTPASFQHLGGLPDWVLIGIFVPWLICSAFTLGFCLGMKDDDLGQEAEQEAGHGH